MHPAPRVVLAVLGALVATSLASGNTQLFAAIMGALAGLAVSEVLYVRDSLTRLRAELSDVRNSLGRRRTEPSERIETPQRLPEPARYAPPSVPPQPPPVRPAAEPRPSSETAPRPFTPADRTALNTRLPVPEENPIIQFLREYFTGGNTLVRA